ncbi:hypothetical protein COCOBI_07-5320 [Coccomyxa sp. Obi]|nr:hypothetical protein COCOBI_07-5320 [Coccomyxa sp. Obi]
MTLLHGRHEASSGILRISSAGVEADGEAGTSASVQLRRLVFHLESWQPNLAKLSFGRKAERSASWCEDENDWQVKWQAPFRTHFQYLKLFLKAN